MPNPNANNKATPRRAAFRRSDGKEAYKAAEESGVHFPQLYWDGALLLRLCQLFKNKPMLLEKFRGTRGFHARVEVA